jgi:hypothetical protein
MKRLQQLNIAVVLSLLFSVATFAGEIGMPKAPPPPPPGSSSTTTPGDIWIDTSAATQGPALASDSAEGIALNLLQSILSVF